MAYYDRMIKTGSIQGISTVEIDHDIGVGVLIWEQSGTTTLLTMSCEMVGPFEFRHGDELPATMARHDLRPEGVDERPAGADGKF